MGFKKAPNGYRHPRKKAKRAIPSPIPDHRGQTVREATKEKKAQPRFQGQLKSSRDGGSDQQSSILIRLVAVPPAEGQIKIYDQMIAAGLAPKIAVLGLLKNGFKAFENVLLSDRSIVPEFEYDSSDEKAIETHRSVSPELLLAAQTKFDPFGVLSRRALGMRIGQAILLSAASGEDHN